VIEIPKLWLGSRESLDYVIQAAGKVAEMRAARGGDFSLDLPPVYAVQDGVAVVDLAGPLINGSAGFFRIFGVMGYDDLRAGLNEAVAKKDVKSVLLSVNSPGGAANGAEDAAAHVKQVDKLKPVVTHTGSQMGSAAYWVGSSARRILAAKTSEVGSIGAVIVHMERSKQLDQEGIKATVIRSGPFKHAGSPYEPLSDEVKADMQSKVDDMNDIFEKGVAANLGVSQKTVHEKMGGGRVFLGFRAQEVGLVHAVSSFDEAFAAAKYLGSR
jgi:signal peptide peptidase SppA